MKSREIDQPGFGCCFTRCAMALNFDIEAAFEMLQKLAQPLPREFGLTFRQRRGDETGTRAAGQQDQSFSPPLERLNGNFSLIR